MTLSTQLDIPIPLGLLPNGLILRLFSLDLVIMYKIYIIYVEECSVSETDCISGLISVSTLLIYINKIKKVKLATIVEGDPMAPFSIATTLRCTLDPYLIMLSVKQGGIKYHFLSRPGIELQSPDH